jgi:drug/metabolite transporter (DMT)-like permease
MRVYILAAVPIVLWASTPLLVTELTTQLPVFQVNWLVTGFSLLSLSLTLTVLRKWKMLRSYSGREVGTTLLLGATGLFPYTTLYYLAFALAPAAAGMSNIINYLWPIWIVVLAIPILKEKLNWQKVLGITLSFTGVYVILTAMWMYNVGAFPCFAVVALLASPLAWPTPKSWLLLFLLGGIVNGFSYLFWILALRVGDTGKIANLVYITPFLALVYLAVFRGTSVTIIQLGALLLFIAGPILQEIPIPCSQKRLRR